MPSGNPYLQCELVNDERCRFFRLEASHPLQIPPGS